MKPVFDAVLEARPDIKILSAFYDDVKALVEVMNEVGINDGSDIEERTIVLSNITEPVASSYQFSLALTVPKENPKEGMTVLSKITFLSPLEDETISSIYNDFSQFPLEIFHGDDPQKNLAKVIWAWMPCHKREAFENALRKRENEKASGSQPDKYAI